MTDDPRSPGAVRRGRLRVYLGAAPGVGKTVAMLEEARRRQARGTDVVVGLVEDHGREHTRAATAGLEIIPRRLVDHRGLQLGELDVDATLARRAAVVVVDEFAHTNAPGSTRAKRWQDVMVLLAAGIDVITTLNIQHLESLNDVVATITGITVAETVPDAVVRAAAAIELVDMSPSSLQRRLAHGHVYPADRVDAALKNFFREGNLTALRELALLWLADRVEEGLEAYRSEHRISGTWAARERILVALPGGGEGEKLLRRGARIAGRAAGRSLVAVHVLRTDGSLGSRPAELEAQRLLTIELGGAFHFVVGDDISATVLSFARSVNATQVVVGASTHSRFTNLIRPSSLTAIVEDSGDIDVHVVTHAGHRTRPLDRFGRALTITPPPLRTLGWWAVAVGLPVAITAAVWPVRTGVNLPTVMLVYLIGVLLAALPGRVVPAVASSVLAALLANLFYTPPVGSLTIATGENTVALVVFVVVAVIVASIVTRSAGRAREAAAGRSEAQLLATAAGGAAGSDDPVVVVLDNARIGFAMSAAALWPEGFDENSGGPEPDRPLAVAGDPAAVVVDSPDVVVPAGAGLLLALYGHPLPAETLRLVEVFGTQAALAHDRRRLQGTAAEASRLRESDRIRTAIVAALSHDLRTPLAAIKASLSGLADTSGSVGEADRAELLSTAAGSADQLDDILGNLLDLSRLNTGVLTPVLAPVSLDEVIHNALIGLPGSWPGTPPAGSAGLIDEIPDDLPLVDTDAGLLERVFANIIGNALRYSPEQPVRLRAERVRIEQGDAVQVEIIDHGPGVPRADRERMFSPFQRLGDAPAGDGIGLGLAVARGLADALGIGIVTGDTAGGGLTMTLTVPIGTDRSPADGVGAIGPTVGVAGVAGSTAGLTGAGSAAPT